MARLAWSEEPAMNLQIVDCASTGLPTLRAIRRHHRARLIRRIESWGGWYGSHARKLYNNPKFCTCCVAGCGNPRRWFPGSKSKQLTIHEKRDLERIRAEEIDRLVNLDPSSLASSVRYVEPALIALHTISSE